MIYQLARRALFALDAERAHSLTLNALASGERFGFGTVLAQRANAVPVQCMGLQFPNPVGLAAGFDKNGSCIDALAKLGFGFIEVGTVTPKAQPGNPKPRIFRLPEAKAVINRLGFNNEGLPGLQRNLDCTRFTGILGINIGKNRDTATENALDDYLIGLRAVYARASYVTINISSPNTQGLRDLQGKAALTRLISELKNAQINLQSTHKKRTPLVLKIAPDLTATELDDIAEVLNEVRIEAVIASNTTTGREGVAHLPNSMETGGLSGAPLMQRSTEVLANLRSRLVPEIALIGTGGICSGTDALAKVRAGAELVQFYTGFIYQGPALIADCVNTMAEHSAVTAKHRSPTPRASAQETQ